MSNRDAQILTPAPEPGLHERLAASFVEQLADHGQPARPPFKHPGERGVLRGEVGAGVDFQAEHADHATDRILIAAVERDEKQVD